MGATRRLLALWPFWVYILLYKVGASIHYSLSSPWGEQVMPIWVVGFVVGLAAALQLVLDVPAGFLLDRFGYRRLLALGTGIFLVAVSFLFLGLTPATYILTLALGALGWLFFGPGVSAYVLSVAQREIAGHFMSMRDIFNSLGVVVGMMLLPLMLLLPVQGMAAIIFLFLAASLLALLLTPKEKVSVHAEKKIPTQHYHVRRHYIREVVGALKHLNPASGLLVLQGFSGSFFYAAIWFVVPLMVVRAADGPLTWGLAIFDFAVVALGFLFGALADRWNKRLLVLSGLFLFSISGVLLGFNFNWWFLVLGFLATSGDELSAVALWAWLDNLNRKHTEDGLVAGAITFAQDLGWAIGPPVAGILFGVIGPTWTIVASSIFLFATWLISIVFTAQHRSIHHAKPARYPKPHRARHKT